MDTRKALDARAGGLMLVLCLSWGLQQVALKATADDISPVLQISLRSGIAAVLVVLLMLVQRERPVWRGHWTPGLAVGFLFALEYLLLGEALRFTTASHAAVFLYTAPVFAALGLHWRLPSERMAPLQWAGTLLAFAGIALAFLARSGPALAPDFLIGDLLALLAGVAWGATTVVIRMSSLARLPAKQTLLYQLVAAFLLLGLAALALGQTGFNPSPLALASLAYQGVIVSFVTFLVWFWLLRHYLASRLGTLSFMTPLFSVVLGAWLLHEPIEPAFLAGAVLVLCGIVLVTGGAWIAQWAAALGRRLPRFLP